MKITVRMEEAAWLMVMLCLEHRIAALEASARVAVDQDALAALRAAAADVLKQCQEPQRQTAEAFEAAVVESAQAGGAPAVVDVEIPSAAAAVDFGGTALATVWEAQGQLPIFRISVQAEVVGFVEGAE